VRGRVARESAESRVKRIVAEQFGVEEEQLTPGTRFIEDLGGESLDTVELVAAMELEFDIEIPDEDAEKNLTVGQVVEYINQRLGGKKSPG